MPEEIRLMVQRPFQVVPEEVQAKARAEGHAFPASPALFPWKKNGYRLEWTIDPWGGYAVQMFTPYLGKWVRSSAETPCEAFALVTLCEVASLLGAEMGGNLRVSDYNPEEPDFAL